MVTGEWRPIPGHLGYRASDRGNVIRESRETTYLNRKTGKWVTAFFETRMLEACFDTRGKYLRICIRGKTYDVHRLVCLTFHGEPPTPEHQAAHRDGRSWHNFADNLYWATVLENAADAVKHGGYKRGENHSGAKLTDEQVAYVREDRSLNNIQCARILGVSNGLISKIRAGSYR